MLTAALIFAVLILCLALGGLIAFALCGANDFPEDQR